MPRQRLTLPLRMLEPTLSRPVPSEFDIIARYFTRPARNAVLGVGDDAALVAPTPGMQLALSADMLVAGRHFLTDVDPRTLGHKVLAVNLSDMAAMGASPKWALLSGALPEIDEPWIAAFADGLFALADRYDVSLVGGDTTSGPLNFSVQIMGDVPPGAALRRDGAKAGDDIWVSGTLGDAAFALRALLGEVPLTGDELAELRIRLETPEPRIALGLALRGLATSALDISDGLAGDLAHIAKRSNLAAVVNVEAVPVSGIVAELRAHPLYSQCVLAGGDDYELCFTAPASARSDLDALSGSLGLPLTRVGYMEAVGEDGPGIRWQDEQGRPVMQRWRAWDHFA